VSRVVNLFYSSLLLIVNALVCHVLWDLTLSLSKEILGDNLHEALKKLTLSLNKASTDCIILLIGFHFIILTLCL
jgi:hypothetical protein